MPRRLDQRTLDDFVLACADAPKPKRSGQGIQPEVKGMDEALRDDCTELLYRDGLLDAWCGKSDQGRKEWHIRGLTAKGRLQEQQIRDERSLKGRAKKAVRRTGKLIGLLLGRDPWTKDE